MGSGRGSGKGKGGVDDDTCSFLMSGCIGCVIFLMIMFACSISTVTPHEYGLKYNGISLQLYDDPADIYESGRWLIGPGQSFFKYSKKLMYMEFSSSAEGGSNNQELAAWTKDGQTVHLEVGFYYRIIKDRIPDVYYLYEQNYVPVFEYIAQTAMKDVTTKFNTIQFFSNRTGINAALKLEVDKRLQAEGHCEVFNFNLMSINVPEKFETAVIDKVIKAQEKRTLEFEQVSKVITADTNVIMEAANADIVKIQAKAYAEANITVEKAKTNAFLARINAEAGALASLANTMMINPYDVHRVQMNATNGTEAVVAGTFKITFDAEESDAIDNNANATEVKAILEAMDKVGTVDVSRVDDSEESLGGREWFVTFTRQGDGSATSPFNFAGVNGTFPSFTVTSNGVTVDNDGDGGDAAAAALMDATRVQESKESSVAVRDFFEFYFMNSVKDLHSSNQLVVGFKDPLVKL